MSVSLSSNPVPVANPTGLRITAPLEHPWRSLAVRTWWRGARQRSLLARRVLDFFLASTILLLATPYLLIRMAFSLHRYGRVLETEKRIGRHGEVFRSLRLSGPWPGRHLGLLLDVLRGHMNLVGPTALSTQQESEAATTHFLLLRDRPGVVTPTWVRSGIGIAYEHSALVDRRFVLERTLRGDLGLLVRALPSLLLRSDTQGTAESVELLSVRIDNVSMDQAIDQLNEVLEGSSSQRVSFANADCLNLSVGHREYLQALASSDKVFADGIGIRLAGRLLGSPLVENVNGTDLFPRLCERLSDEGRSLFLLGARPGIAEAAAENMRRRYPRLRIAGVRHGYFSPDEEAAVIAEINSSGADAVLVGLGAPRQELWLQRHQQALHPKLLLGVGGLFDFYSDRIPRAPIWLREIGLEWFWRLAQEPQRLWKRYLVGNPIFVLRVLGQKFRQGFGTTAGTLPGPSHGGNHS